MRKIRSLVVSLCFLSVLVFVTMPLSAGTISMNYCWYDTGGTVAMGMVEGKFKHWTDGNVGGNAVVNVLELYNEDEQYFQYTITNLLANSDTYRIMYFAVNNPCSVTATDWTEGEQNWCSAHTNVSPGEWEWVWKTDVFSAGSGGSKDNMRIYTTAPRGIVDGTVKFYTSADGDPDTYYGKVSAPVPSPATFMLLISGLLGMVGLRKRLG